MLNAGSGQTLSVTFTPTDAANYTTATKTVSINVLKATPLDHVVDARGHHLRHGAERHAAERDRQRARHLRLHPGRRHRAERGRGQTLSVTFTPTDAANYTTATKTTTINVLKATPVDHAGRRRRTSPTARR